MPKPSEMSIEEYAEFIAFCLHWSALKASALQKEKQFHSGGIVLKAEGGFECRIEKGERVINK